MNNLNKKDKIDCLKNIFEEGPVDYKQVIKNFGLLCPIILILVNLWKIPLNIIGQLLALVTVFTVCPIISIVYYIKYKKGNF